MAMMLVMVVASNATDWAQAEYSKNSKWCFHINKYNYDTDFILWVN
jgi:hypothetical protein